MQSLLDGLVSFVRDSPRSAEHRQSPQGGEFGIAIATADGMLYGAGDCGTPFPLQSVAKVFSLALAWRQLPDGLPLSRLSREPSSARFDSIAELDRDRGVPRNPFVNAGALVVVDALLTMTGGDAFGAVRELLLMECGSNVLEIDHDALAVERARSHRNRAIGHLLASYENLEYPVETVLQNYFALCATAMTARQLALAGLFLARNGASREPHMRVLTDRQTRQVNSLILSSGTYDAAGTFASRVGFPCKSGVSGAILAVVPHLCSIAVWSPGLDSSGNSVAGLVALDELARLTGWTVF